MSFLKYEFFVERIVDAWVEAALGVGSAGRLARICNYCIGLLRTFVPVRGDAVEPERVP